MHSIWADGLLAHIHLKGEVECGGWRLDHTRTAASIAYSGKDAVRCEGQASVAIGLTGFGPDVFIVAPGIAVDEFVFVTAGGNLYAERVDAVAIGIGQGSG